ncbi:MAG: class I SAM-dependent methyltransferase [Candidatus Methanofastidiosia archaeon]
MNFKGDTERQSILRDRMIKKAHKIKKNIYISKISSALKRRIRLLDIGCGTAHIIQELATCYKNAIFVGLDISPAMLKISSVNIMNLPNVILVEGDGLKLPFPDCSFDFAITRLAEYSPQEAYRVLRKGGYFFEYGLGPEANKEIFEFFQDKIERENFFFPKSLKEWKEEVCKDIKDVGFVVDSIKDYKEKEYYQSEEGLMDLIEMVPLVRNFNEEKDRKRINELVKKYNDETGIKITWHYYIMEARRL